MKPQPCVRMYPRLLQRKARSNEGVLSAKVLFHSSRVRGLRKEGF